MRVSMDAENGVVVGLDACNQGTDCEGCEKSENARDRKGDRQSIGAFFFFYIIVTEVDQRAIDAAHGNRIADIVKRIDDLSVFGDTKGIDEKAECRYRKAESKHFSKGSSVSISAPEKGEGYARDRVHDTEYGDKSL